MTTDGRRRQPLAMSMGVAPTQQQVEHDWERAGSQQWDWQETLFVPPRQEGKGTPDSPSNKNNGASVAPSLWRKPSGM